MINDKCFWGILLVLWGVTHFLEFCAPYNLRSLCCSLVNLMVSSSLGMRSFAVAGPVIWNSLPAALWTATLSLLTFARHLKAHLFGWSAARLKTIYDVLYKSTHHHHHRHCIQLLKYNGQFVTIVRSTHHTANSSHSQLVSCDELTDSDKPTPESKTNLDFTKQEMKGWQWHQLDHMQIICTLFQTDNHASISSLNVYRPDVFPDVH